MRTILYHRQVGRPVLFLGLFTVEELVAGMVIYALHQTLDGRLGRLALLVLVYVAAVAWLRLARRRGHAWHRALTLAQPRQVRAGGQGRPEPWA